MGGGERGKKKERKKKKKKKIGIRKTHPEEIMKKKFSYQVRPSLSPIFFFFFFFSLSLFFPFLPYPRLSSPLFFPTALSSFPFLFFSLFAKFEKKKKRGVSEEEGGSFFFFFFFWYEKKKKHHTLYFKRREKNSKIFLVANSQGPNLSFFLRKRGWIREINDAQTGMLPGKRS